MPVIITASFKREIYQDVVMADLPVAYWKLNETTGTTAFDSVGSFNGTYQGTYTQNVAGLITTNNDTALGLTGVANSGINVGNVTPFSRSGSFSVEFAFQGTSTQERIIIDRETSGTHYPEWKITMTSGKVRFLTSNADNPGGLHALFTSVDTYNDGLPHYGVCVYDVNTTTKSIYIDGVLMGSDSWVGPLWTSTSPISIGYNNGTNNSPFDGTLDDIIIYDYALPLSRIIAHYQAAQ